MDITQTQQDSAIKLSCSSKQNHYPNKNETRNLNSRLAAEET